MTPLLVLAGMLLTQGVRYDTDTTFAVSQGTRLKIHNQGGDVTIKAWDRQQVRIQADHSSRTEIEVDTRGQVLEITARSRRSFSAMVDYEITVPTWMALDVAGMYAEVSISGTKAPIKVETLEGNIDVKGGAEVVSLQTVNGRIELVGARGRISLNAVSDDVVVEDAEGDLTVESVSGDLDLRQITARSLDAQTVSGDILFGGRLASTGSYALITHSGDVTVALPEATNATIGISSASGSVSSSMDLRAERQSRRRQTYRMGDGGASLDIETFSGDVDLIRPGEVDSRAPDRKRDVKLKLNRKNRPEREQEDDHDDADEHRSEATR